MFYENEEEYQDALNFSKKYEKRIKLTNYKEFLDKKKQKKKEEKILKRFKMKRCNDKYQNYVFSESFFQKKNEKILFNFLNFKDNITLNGCLFETFKRKFLKERKFIFLDKRVTELIKKIDFNFEKLIKFRNFNKFNKKNLIFNSIKEKEFNENFKKNENIYHLDLEVNQKRISKIFLDEILLEIIKFLDIETLLKVNI
jgi:hypothetical protein